MAKKRTVESMLTDAKAPMEMRIKLLHQVCGGEGEVEVQVLTSLLESAAAGGVEKQVEEKAAELSERLQELKDGPRRCATFIRMVSEFGQGRRAEVLVPDGSVAFCVVPEAALIDQLRCGDTIWLDAGGTAVLFGSSEPNRLGEEARFERELPGGGIEVSVGELGRYVFRPTAQLRDQIECGEAEPGATLVVCQRQMIAWRALPPAQGESHLRFLSAQPPPDVLVGRDVGAPRPFIEDIRRHVRREVADASIGARFGVRRSRLLLVTGVAGSGKSHSIKALWRALYEDMAEALGVAIEDVPQRVFELEPADILNKWLGESDKNITRFFKEVGQVAAERFVAPDGRSHELPVLVICEEIDALARQRGQDSIHDRIQTSLLTELDPAQALFQDRLVVVVCTTNIPSALDVAFVRRAGGSVVHFERVGRLEFRAILEKHLGGRPFEDGDAGCSRTLADLTAWLFAPNGPDAGQVELTYVGQPNTVTKHRRDFITAGLIDRAVQQACAEACDEEWEQGVPAWLTSERLMRAIEAQVRAVVDQLTPGNCDQYLTLPDAMRVGTVRRIAQPAVLPVVLERAS